MLRALELRDKFAPYDDVLDSLAATLGLFPYANENLSLAPIPLSYAFHRPMGLDEGLVFHKEQAQVYRALLSGESLVVSAPTSFGKSKIVDALIASGKYKNIVIVVPTLALIDETRRRVASLDCPHKIVTQINQQPAEYNIFIFTGERVLAYRHFSSVDLFVLDEFYKIGALHEDESRTVALNQAFARLLRLRPRSCIYSALVFVPSSRALRSGSHFGSFRRIFRLWLRTSTVFPEKGRNSFDCWLWQLA